MGHVELPTTQRAYTLRLHGVDPKDNSWRDALWATHEAINKGAKVFGDWLLTLRGGLDHKLAEPPPPPKKQSRSNDETAALRKNRRILLALSWLSVEDERGAPTEQAFRVATGAQTKAERDDKVLAALRAILAGRGLSESEVEAWMSDCTGSLTARIRDDAVWINRSACFDVAVERIGPTLTRDEVWDILEPFFASRESYLAPVTLADDDDNGGKDEKAKDLVQKAGQWLSSRFGTGQGANFAVMAKVYEAMTDWARSAPAFDNGPSALAHLSQALADFNPTSSTAEGILGLISGPGYKSATRNIIKAWGARGDPVELADLARCAEVASADHESSLGKVGGKGRRPWSDSILEAVEQSCGFTYLQQNGPARHSEFAVMLDHAARRVSIGHSWIKRAEAQRLRFEQDAARLDQVPAEAVAWLDAFILERSGSAGGDYRIRRRAIEGWDKVLERWSNKACITAEDRIKAARGLQDDPEIDKFGDIQLFEALAADDAAAVWQRGGKPDASALKDYVLGHDARFRQQHYKVPAYRHPDPLRHPVFGDFGNSRWDIAYAVHEAAKAAGSRRTPDAQTAAWLRDRRGLRMGLWNMTTICGVPLRWSSKRLSTDLALDRDREGQPVRTVTRADRLGRAAAGLEQDEVPSAAALFALKDWNGRLQAPRAELDAIARRIEKHGWDATAHVMRDRLSWLVSFSAKLECRGPFVEYVRNFDPEHSDRPFISKKSGEMAVAHDGNDTRKSLAKLGLSRLPGLRILSVDLGHRFAASCAVWESISREQFEQECDEARRKEGWCVHVCDLYATIEGPKQETKRVTAKARAEGRVRQYRPTTIYRRIGPDKLPDGAPHPAPWARLDRQFLIKLQGEEASPRRASEAEREAVAAFECGIGRERTQPHDQLPTRIDKLMSEAVRSARLGLYRHADAARIAYAFMPGSVRHKPGGATEEHTPESRAAAILDALVRWRNLCGDARSRWRDERAQALWDEHIAPQLKTAPPELAEDASGPERKAHRKKIEEALSSLAKALAARGEAGVPALFNLWRVRWEADHAQWPGYLKRLNRWLLPRGLRARPGETHEQTIARKARLGAARNVGGLSLMRIATIRELWQVQKAFHYGAEPDNPRAGVCRIEQDAASTRKFGDTALRTMERMREQRVKQIASRIAASALGLGGHWKSVPRKDSGGRLLLDQDGRQRTKRVWVEEPSPKYPPCHAVVIENLRNYRPDELQTHRENKALMSWSSAKVAKYLGEACQLNGLHLREISPNYTSRQCSRTGLPGLRCVEVSVNPKTAEPDIYWWKKALAVAEKKTGTNGTSGDAESRLIVKLAQHLKKLKESNAALPKSVRLPRRGGDLFVAAPSWKDIRAARLSAGAAVQADLNAAANVGLRALLDPDFAGRWWYVPCDTASGKPAKDKCAGAACLDLDTVLLKSDDVEGEKPKKAKGKSREITNAWHDITERDGWKQYTPYWNDVSARVIERLRAANRLDKFPSQSVLAPPETPW